AAPGLGQGAARVLQGASGGGGGRVAPPQRDGQGGEAGAGEGDQRGRELVTMGETAHGGVANWPGNGLASRRRCTSSGVQGTGLVPISLKSATPMTPTLRVSPVFCPAYEPRTEPKRKAATASMLWRNPSISSSPRGSLM